MIPLAHARQNIDGIWEKQTLQTHLTKVAEKSAQFAQSFGAANWSKIAGLLHDIGKADPRWQAYFKRGSGYDPEASIELDGDRGKRPNHSDAGAAVSLEGVWGDQVPQMRKIFRGIAYIIAGHHTGLADWNSSEGQGGSLIDRLGTQSGELKESLFKDIAQYVGNGERQITLDPSFLQRAGLPAQPPLGLTCLKNWNEISENFHLWVRMLFSCLVDADSLDTEAFCTPKKSVERGVFASLAEMKAAFDSHMEKLASAASQSVVNRCRQQVLASCRIKAKESPGFFALTVPTGGGKTFASMAFALEHSLHWDKKRIVVAIPYTSIIEQTAVTLREAFGQLEENVLEHHSNLDPAKETSRSLLVAENWESPVVVTTNVQLFESLLSSKRSQSRKIHNLADSVIILDEAQMMPLPHLRPLLSVLKGLVKHFGVTVLLCTATQPALSGCFGTGEEAFDGLPQPKQIIDNVPELFMSLRRVIRATNYDSMIPREWRDLAKDLIRQPRVLTVVNRRLDCRELYEELKKLNPQNLFHLSAFMCAQHRSDRIVEIKKLLRNSAADVRVVSTQLIEAGVDVDFPVVYRALCGLDSAVQAAGRCNREGRISDMGKLYLFSPVKPSPRGLLSKGESTLRSMLMEDPELDIFNDAVITQYFRRYYADVNSFDEAHFRERLLKGAPDFEFYFRSFDENFRLIDNKDQVALFVAYQNDRTQADGAALIEQLRRLGPERTLLRKLQRYSVTIRKETAAALSTKGAIMETENGFYYQAIPQLYDMNYGVNLEAEGIFII